MEHLQTKTCIHGYDSTMNANYATLADLSVPSEISATSGGVIGVLLLVILTLVMIIAILGVYIKTREKKNLLAIGTHVGASINKIAQLTTCMYIHEFGPLDT